VKKMAGKAVYENDICPKCRTPWDKKIETTYYNNKEQEIPKAVCGKCGNIY